MRAFSEINPQGILYTDEWTPASVFFVCFVWAEMQWRVKLRSFSTQQKKKKEKKDK